MDKYQSRFTGVEIDARLAKVNQEFTLEEKEKLSELVNYDDTEVWEALGTCVEKVEGKGLSSNDFTDDDKSKLNGLHNYDDTAITQAVEELQTSKANADDVYNKDETYNKDEIINQIITKVAEIVAGAPESFDTLKELADWIDSHEDSAAAMNTAIKQNATDISNRYTKEETDNKYLGKTATAAAAVCDGAGGNIAEQFADITARHDYGYAYSGSSQKGWHKAAECTFSVATTRQAVFLITGHAPTVCGALSVSVTSSGSPIGIEALDASWIYRTRSINPGYFVAVAKCVDGIIQAELWVKLTSAWQPIKLNQVSSTSRTAEVHDDTAWKACNSSTASESYPTDYALTSVSVDSSVAKYDASGNDIAATYLTHGVGITIPSGSDLNDSAYLVPGVYRAASNAVAPTLLNCPTKYGFRMEVKATIDVTRLVRLIYPNLDSGTYFMQNVTADGFGKWYKFSGEEVTTSTTAE